MNPESLSYNFSTDNISTVRINDPVFSVWESYIPIHISLPMNLIEYEKYLGAVPGIYCLQIFGLSGHSVHAAEGVISLLTNCAMKA
jgi:hypothetical protein